MLGKFIFKILVTIIVILLNKLPLGKYELFNIIIEFLVSRGLF